MVIESQNNNKDMSSKTIIKTCLVKSQHSIHNKDMSSKISAFHTYLETLTLRVRIRLVVQKTTMKSV
jgi:hypothetical protein